MRWPAALWLGFLSWLVPFVIGFAAFPLKKANPALFETTMTLVVLLTAVLLFQRYFRGQAVTISQALWLGFLWLAINLVFDYPMFAYGPMKMTAAGYYSSIGLDYLIFPIFGFGAAWTATRSAARSAVTPS